MRACVRACPMRVLPSRDLGQNLLAAVIPQTFFPVRFPGVLHMCEPRYSAVLHRSCGGSKLSFSLFYGCRLCPGLGCVLCFLLCFAFVLCLLMLSLLFWVSLSGFAFVLRFWLCFAFVLGFASRFHFCFGFRFCSCIRCCSRFRFCSGFVYVLCVLLRFVSVPGFTLSFHFVWSCAFVLAFAFILVVPFVLGFAFVLSCVFVLCFWCSFMFVPGFT